VTEVLELALVDSVDSDVVVTVAEVSVLVKMPLHMYWNRLLRSVSAPVAVA
jgi:hypothetical protein